MTSTKEKVNKAYEIMKGEFGYKNKMAAPRLLKIVISSGTGSGIKRDRNRGTLVAERLSKITGQKPAGRLSKKSIAGFKLRENEEVGVMTTLRGERMYSFVDKLINVAFPRTKDFRGLPKTSIDSIGNMTLGIKEHTIFPETGDEDIKDIFGLAITFVTTAKNKKEAETFFNLLGFPFKK